ncbi:MAG: Ku protein [Candidatus Acidiferrales bacterium]
MASSTWKGFITFGLLSIPIRLYAAARASRIQLHQLHSVCNTRLRQPLFCPTCNKIVDRSEVVKGYEKEDGSYALIDPAEVKKIAPQSTRSMEILAFVKESEIDPLFFDSSFFAVPEEEGRKAYQLLLKTLESKKRVGIAKVAMHQREYTVFIRPYDHGLTLHTMYFANEVREAPGYGKTENIKLKPQEIKLAEQLVENLSEEFNLKKYHDEFQYRLKELIESKQTGREVAAAPQPHRAPVIDMMEALKKSLAASGAAHKKPMHAERATESHRRGTRRAAS